ncbi:hypothetical protein H113_08518 [Trichophyton rubrum MR1459]|nr:hypothetical protein H104_08400 [Trichophyton rubrum CBS 289.86]EZF79695.1 hypothetical protein H110_08450 [Trichophyton rubrum MR1448]EZF90291.1 hypothetical protein H113_08518 [Trichophyton rubrum MR1459]EZG01419.1 hypothetical protein H106_08323 [Trichophyton rubrum CBS 735.88]
MLMLMPIGDKVSCSSPGLLYGCIPEGSDGKLLFIEALLSHSFAFLSSYFVNIASYWPSLCNHWGVAVTCSGEFLSLAAGLRSYKDTLLSSPFLSAKCWTSRDSVSLSFTFRESSISLYFSQYLELPSRLSSEASCLSSRERTCPRILCFLRISSNSGESLIYLNIPLTLLQAPLFSMYSHS